MFLGKDIGELPFLSFIVLSGGTVPVPEKELACAFPEKVKFEKGNPLETNKDFDRCKMP